MLHVFVLKSITNKVLFCELRLSLCDKSFLCFAFQQREPAFVPADSESPGEAVSDKYDLHMFSRSVFSYYSIIQSAGGGTLTAVFLS